jgi:hypothetical protein
MEEDERSSFQLLLNGRRTGKYFVNVFILPLHKSLFLFQRKLEDFMLFNKFPSLTEEISTRTRDYKGDERRSAPLFEM